MAYRIDLERSLEKEVRRIAREQLSAAVGLLEAQPAGPHAAIHDARKHIKRTRALYRLVASGAEDFVASENDRLRGIASELSHLRDAAALAESARYLQGVARSEDMGSPIRAMAAALERRRDRVAGGTHDVGDKVKKAAAGLREAESALVEFRMSEGSGKAAACLAGGWEKVGDRATEALAACSGSEQSTPFHDLRKRAQDRWMHSGLLRPIWPTAMIALRQAAKSLVDLLGHEHDLVLLGDHIAVSDDLRSAAEHRDILQLAILEERHRLQDAGREAGKALFDARPDRDAAFVRLLIRKH